MPGEDALWVAEAQMVGAIEERREGVKEVEGEEVVVWVVDILSLRVGVGLP